MKTTPPPPTSSDLTPKRVSVQLDAQEMALLAFISNQPETPLSRLYKGFGVGVKKGNQLRDGLKAQGLVQELDVVLSPKGAGRPATVLIPTLKGWELLGKEPPPGRGGAIHRHIQQLITDGATAKGFTTKCEYDLGNGGIVDVHLDNGKVRIAVEIAIASRPSRELAHIKNALSVGYDKVVDVFADERLLERTQESLEGEFSDEERAKIELIPLNKLSELIYVIVSGELKRVSLTTEIMPPQL